MTIAVNSKPLLSCEIREARGGAWSAELVVDSEEALDGTVQVEFDDGAVTFVGTAREGFASSDNGKVRARVIGGAGGLSNIVPCLNYTQVEVRTVIQDVLTSTGEALDATSSEALLGTRLSHWTRLEGAAGRALQSLMDEVGGTWRVLRNGRVWVGTEEWPELKMEFDLLEQHTSENAIVVGPKELPLVVPGVTFDGKQVSEVTTQVDGGRLVQRISFEGAEVSRRGRQLDAHHGLIRSAIGNQLDYSALYPARVVRQSNDGQMLDILPDDERVRGQGLTRVPIRYGVPGVVTKLAKGARVLLGFEAADPKRPFVAIFEAQGIEEYTLTTDKKVTLVAGETVQIECTDVVVNASGSAKVVSPDVQLGNGALDAVALATRVQTELQLIKTAFDAHVHPTGVGPSGPPPPLPAPGSPGASNTKAS